jgi:hypothetical protein
MKNEALITEGKKKGPLLWPQTFVNLKSYTMKTQMQRYSFYIDRASYLSKSM